MATCSSYECSAEWADWYIREIRELRESRSRRMSASVSLPSMRREHHVEVGQQPRAARHVGALHRGAFVVEVGAQAHDVGRREFERGAADHRALEHVAHLEHLARLLDAGLGDAGARVPSRA